MQHFLSGMTTAGFLVAALFFFRFWWKAKDALFAYFGISFVLFAAGQAASLIVDSPHEDRTWIYLLRLAGFALLLVAIVRKNMANRVQP